MMKNNITPLKKSKSKLFNDKIIEQTTLSQKMKLSKFLKTNNISYQFKIPFKNGEHKYNFSLLFQATLFMLNNYYNNKTPKNTITVLNIIENDELEPYNQSLPNIPDFLITYVSIKLFDSIAYKYKVSFNLRTKNNIVFIKEKCKYFYTQYYKDDYNLLYKDIILLARMLYKIQHPLLNKDKIEMLLADIATTFVLDRGDIKTTQTINPKTNMDRIDSKILQEILTLPFIDYNNCFNIIENGFISLKTIFTNYYYFNIKIALKYSDYIFKNDMLKKYKYCYNALNIFLYHHEKLTVEIKERHEYNEVSYIIGESLAECLSHFNPGDILISPTEEHHISNFLKIIVKDDLMTSNINSLILKFKIFQNMNKLTINSKISQKYKKSRI